MIYEKLSFNIHCKDRKSRVELAARTKQTVTQNGIFRTGIRLIFPEKAERKKWGYEGRELPPD